MKIKNLSPFLVGTLVGSIRPKTPAMTVVVRATFELSKEGQLRTVDATNEEPRPLSSASHRDDDDELHGGALTPSDFAEFKPHAEVLARGSCHVPHAALTECPVKITVGDWSKTLRVVASRVGGREVPFTSMPLDWQHAFGGASYAQNPDGCGYDSDQRPNVLYAADQPARGAELKPAGFGAINRRWPQRASKLGKNYGEEYRRTRAPYYASDFDQTFFQEAPPDQWLGYLRGDEPVVFHNLHPEASVVQTALPGVRVRAFFRDKLGGFHELTMQLDTLFADLDVRRLELSWRGRAEVHDDDLEDVVTLLVADEKLLKARLPVAHYERLAAEFEADPLGIKGRLPPTLEPSSEPSEPQDLQATLSSQLGDAQPEQLKEAAPWLDALVAHAANHAEVGAALAQRRAEAAQAEAAGPARVTKPGAFPYLGLRRHVREVIGRGVEAREKALRSGAKPESLQQLMSIEAIAEDPRWLELDPSYTPPKPLSTDAPGPGANLVDRDLSDADLSGLDLSGANLEGAILTRARLRGAVLRGARLYGATLFKADLCEADLREADLTRANLAFAQAQRAQFDEAIVEQCCFEDADLEQASFIRAKGEYAVFTRAKLSRARFREAVLAFLEMDDADFSEAAFERANLRKGRFSGSRGAKAIFDGAELSRASFAEANLDGARFFDVRAEESVWSAAQAPNAILAYAQLRGCHMDRLNAPGADFRGSNLKHARLYRAILDQASFISANLFGVELSKARLTGAKLVKANLYEARFGQTNLKDADLTSANLKRSSLERT